MEAGTTRPIAVAFAASSLPEEPEPGVAVPDSLPPGEPAVGDLPAALLREWGPILKPVGLGLLTALQSFEETTPGHPFFGWAHCTQTALGAYLDTSQDTIARYTSLLVTCGLLRVEEVETPRGRQKLYRIVRGGILPSLGLLEHLLFDADAWTRKHTAWLLDSFSPLGGETELARLLAALRRAYTCSRDAGGRQQVVAGPRLTAPGAYLARRAAAAQEPLPIPLSAPCAPVGQPTVPHPQGASAALPAASGDPRDADFPRPSAVQAPGVRLLPPGSGSPYHADRPFPPRHQTGESATGGFGPAAESAPGGSPAAWESASGGIDRGGESASGGFGQSPGVIAPPLPGRESAPGGLPAPLPNVYVPHSIHINENNGSVNGAEEELLAWATALLGDTHSLEWHRRLLQEVGAERYRAALDATRRAQERGRVDRPGAYFTGILKRMGAAGARPVGEPRPPPASASAPAHPAVPAPASVDEDTLWRTWQAALAVLRARLPADDVRQALRYTVLLELDPVAGWALIGVPNAGLVPPIRDRLCAPIEEALLLVQGRPLRIAVTVLAAGGPLPTLTGVLAGDQGSGVVGSPERPSSLIPGP